VNDPKPVSDPDVAIRIAQPQDLARAGELTYAAYADSNVLGTDPDYGNYLRDAASHAEIAEVLVAVEPDDEVIGTVRLTFPGSPMTELAEDGEAEFRMLAVDPKAQGRGVGQALVEACIDRSRERGSHTLVISVIAGNDTAERLYRRMGFERLPERDWSPVPGTDLLAWRLTL
jgi:ribosomal protein S18 acetylase RimI-like enzyme